LGAIYKEMGEPEKAQITKTKKDHFASSKKELLAGAVVFSKDSHTLMIALVHDVFGYWTLPKGHIQGENAHEEEVARTIKREIGIDSKVLDLIGENEYIANKPEQGKVVKHVSYYLATSAYEPVFLEKKGGLDDVKWFSYKESSSLRMYDDIKSIIQKAHALLETNPL
jgi:ADP-ribose pyrophosphatase YjhB (NUDIX family)